MRDENDQTLSVNDVVIPAAAPQNDVALDDETARPAPYNRMVNSTWRILEEQRLNALEIADDCNAQIQALEAKRDDATRSAAMCEAAQKVATP